MQTRALRGAVLQYVANDPQDTLAVSFHFRLVGACAIAKAKTHSKFGPRRLASGQHQKHTKKRLWAAKEYGLHQKLTTMQL